MLYHIILERVCFLCENFSLFLSLSPSLIIERLCCVCVCILLSLSLSLSLSFFSFFSFFSLYLSLTLALKES